MGARPWHYFTPYDPDIRAAFHALREREFHAGRYYPVILSLEFPIDSQSPPPGAKHASIDAAVHAAGATGTRSVLDVTDLELGGPSRPGVMVPLSREMLTELYGSEKPTREMVEQNMDFFLHLDRGEAVFAILYEEGNPCEILFAGYSYD